MELKEVIYGRRSVRRYLDKPIEKEVLEELLLAACQAPSAVNLQPWYFVVCHSKEAMAQLVEIMGGSIFSLRNVLNRRFSNHPEVIEETVDFVKHMGNAQACVLAFLQQETYDEKEGAIESVAAALQNLVLTAYSKGIASCWLTAPLHVGDELRAAFAPGKGPLLAAVTLGYSDVTPKAPRRKEGRVVFR